MDSRLLTNQGTCSLHGQKPKKASDGWTWQPGSLPKCSQEGPGLHFMHLFRKHGPGARPHPVPCPPTCDSLERPLDSRQAQLCVAHRAEASLNGGL